MTQLENNDILGDINLSSALENNNPSKKDSINLLEEHRNLDILFGKEEVQDIIDATQDISIEAPLINEKKISPLSGIIFITKYIATSALIFAMLLVSTNYSAYTNIVKSYVFHEQMNQTTKSLINSVEASNIKEKFEDNISQEKEKTGLIQEKDRNMNMKKLIGMSKDMKVSMDIEITPYENRIVIPKIGQNIPLVDIKNRQVTGANELNDIFMKELENGVVRYPGSANPGEKGNSFIFGHSSNFPWIKGDYNEAFSLLDKVTYDDDIIVYFNQKKYTYRIKEKKVIHPGDLSILERDKDKKEITVMTCWPIGTTLNRLIVTGELIEQE